MFIPVRKNRDTAQTCTRLPRLLTFATTGAVFMGAGFGVMPASADPRSDRVVPVVVDIVGDSYMAGAGLRDTYIDPADPRYRSSAAPALQALARLQSDNPLLRVDANLVASSGAQTVDFFHAQAGPDNTLVNAPQRDQVRPDTQLVIVGFGGQDAHLAAVLAHAQRTTGGPNTVLDKEIRELGPLLDWTASDEEYIAQAKSSAPGEAPTLVARMIQVMAGISARAPQAKIVVTTYPLAADPQNEHASTMVGEDELTTVRKFGYDLNQAINRAVQICACGSLADVAEAVAGHEIYTTDPAFNDHDEQAPQESFQPNDKGASLIANPIANVVANVLQITPPKPSDGRVTVPENIEIRSGVPDRDGDTVVDFEDHAPDDPTRAIDTSHDERDTKHDTDDGKSHRGSRSNHSDNDRQRRGGVIPLVIPVVNGLLPGVSPIEQYGLPPTDPTGNNHPGTVESRPSAREQTIPTESTALPPQPTTAPPVPGEDASPTQAQNAAVEDVIYRAVPAGYVSSYSTKALRVTTLPADMRNVSDKAALETQMSQSLLNVSAQDVRNGFRDRLSQDIDAIHNAKTVAEQDAAIAVFNQTAAEFNATELAARDAYGAHPVNEQGEIVRITPTSLADLAMKTTTNPPVDATTLPAFDGVKTGTVVDPGPLGATNAPVEATTLPAFDGVTTGTVVDPGPLGATYGPVDTSTVSAVSDQAPAESAQSVTVADVAGETTLSAQVDTSTLSAASDQAQAQASEASASGTVGPDGLSGTVGGKTNLGKESAKGTVQVGDTEVGLEGNATADAEATAGGKAKVGAKGVDVDLTGKVGVEAGVEGKATIGDAEVGVEGTASVGVEGKAKADISRKGVDVDVKGFVGGRVGAKARGEYGFLGAEGEAEGWTGLGFEGGFRAGRRPDGKFTFGLGLGLAPLYGGKLSFAITLDPDKLQQSIDDAIDSLNPWGPADQMDSPRSQAQDDPNYDGPTDSPDDAPGESQMNSPRSQAQDDPNYDGPTDSPDDAPGESQMNSPRSQAQDDPNYDGPTDSPVDAPGESQMNSPRSQAQDDPNYDGPTDTPADSVSDPDAAISSADPGNDTIAGYSGDDTLGGYSEAGYSDAGYSDSGYGDSGYGDTSDGFGTSDAGAPGDGTSDGGPSDGGFSGGGGDFGGGGATGDFGGSDVGGMGDAGMSGDSGLGDSGGMGDSGDSGGMSGDSGGSGMGGDSGGMGGDSGDSGGMSGDSGGMGGDSGDSGGMGGDSGGGMGGGDSGGGDSGGGGMGSGGMGGSGGDGGGSGGDGGGGDGGSSSGGMGSGGMGGGPGGGDGGGF